jgi:hypothetical protein
VFWNFCFFVCFKYAKQKLLVNKISYCDTVQTTGHLIITYLTHLGTINGTEVSYIHVVTVLHLSHQLSKICWILCYLKTKNKCQLIPDSVYTYSVTSLSPIRRGFAPGFVNYKKGALDSQPQLIKFTSCLPMVGGSLQVLRLLPPLKLVAMI